MNKILDSHLTVEEYDVFQVMQLTRETPLEHGVAVDIVSVLPGKISKVHRHSHTETVLFITAGSGTISVGDSILKVKKGDRVYIGKGVFHGIATEHEILSFISVQSPPILDESHHILDLEKMESE